MHCVVAGPLRPATGAFSLHRLPIPVTAAVGRDQARRWPELFAEAVEIDANMRGKLAFAKEPYLHPRRVPLAQAVSLDEAEPRDGRHPDGFGNECEGHCGV